MQLVVEAARVADGLTLVVPPPQGRVLRAAVGAAEAQSPRGRLKDGTLSIKSKIVFIKFRTDVVKGPFKVSSPFPHV